MSLKKNTRRFQEIQITDNSKLKKKQASEKEAQLFLLQFEFGSGLDTKLEDVGALSIVVDDHETVYL